ncbi:hypothetical protein [Clostridium sp.]|uniref:hypothetical protein n=1 Tax=Clostridium sp. TaxID=1506 RepID=UPI0025BDC04D|nr:hypothetical protein [Clostridium sp.]MCI9303520.1 hypothetical protein [Clostridium sp.]
MINKKENIIKMSIALIVIGFIISIVGFGVGEFNLDIFKSSDTQKWYKVISID